MEAIAIGLGDHQVHVPVPDIVHDQQCQVIGTLVLRFTIILDLIPDRGIDFASKDRVDASLRTSSREPYRTEHVSMIGQSEVRLAQLSSMPCKVRKIAQAIEH
jgi:hypothetical protein